MVLRHEGALISHSALDLNCTTSEVYSIGWVLPDCAPRLDDHLQASDVSHGILEFARRGECSLQNIHNRSDAMKLVDDAFRDQGVGFSPFKFMSENEKDAIFDQDGGPPGTAPMREIPN